ncbi:MAG: helix-turn-helix domain-containing protein [Pseudonocardiaceae bacterium]
MNTAQPHDFGDYIKQAREQHGYSVRHLASLTGVAPSTIARIEYNTLITPAPDLVLTLIKNLDLDPATAIGLLEPYQRLTHASLPNLADYLRTKYHMKRKDITEIITIIRQQGYHPK